MAHPTQRSTSSSRKRRASHRALTRRIVSSCTQCGTSIVSHRACANCGFYKGVKVIAKPQEDRHSKKKKK